MTRTALERSVVAAALLNLFVCACLFSPGDCQSELPKALMLQPRSQDCTLLKSPGTNLHSVLQQTRVEKARIESNRWEPLKKPLNKDGGPSYIDPPKLPILRGSG